MRRPCHCAASATIQRSSSASSAARSLTTTPARPVRPAASSSSATAHRRPAAPADGRPSSRCGPGRAAGRTARPAAAGRSPRASRSPDRAADRPRCPPARRAAERPGRSGRSRRAGNAATARCGLGEIGPVIAGIGRDGQIAVVLGQRTSPARASRQAQRPAEDGVRGGEVVGRTSASGAHVGPQPARRDARLRTPGTPSRPARGRASRPSSRI